MSVNETVAAVNAAVAEIEAFINDLRSRHGTVEIKAHAPVRKMPVAKGDGPARDSRRVHGRAAPGAQGDDL
jgi:hypothetical protein